MKKLSIIIPVYNREKMITTALDSIPVRDDIEVLVIDDCSTDNTLEILYKYDRLPLKVFHNDINKGPGLSRNVGLDNMTGEYFTFLDSDDWLITEDVNEMLDKYLGQNFDIITPDRKKVGGISWGGRDLVITGRICKSSLVKNIRQTDSKWGEDRVFLRDIIRNNPKLLCIDSDLQFYVYNCRPDDKDTLTYLHNKGN